MAKTGKARLRAHLKTLSQAECAEQVLELWERFPAVRDYFASRFGGADAEGALKRAQAQIEREFSTNTRSPRGEPAVARAVITEFRRSQVRPEAIVELLLSYVEVALDFAVTFGDDRALRGVPKAFDEALEIAEGADLIRVVSPRVERVLEKYGDVGWGVGEHLQDTWLQYEPWDDNGKTNRAP